jgi:hypothetical protein
LGSARLRYSFPRNNGIAPNGPDRTKTRNERNRIMKTKLIALAIAAGVTAGSAGIASSASAAPASPSVIPAASITIDLGGIFGVRFGHRHHGYHHRRRCRRLFILGFRYGNPRARYLWRRYCRGYYHY